MEKNGKIVVLSLWFWLLALNGFACTIPVFRYALELWKSDPYIVYLMHDGTQAEQINEAETFLSDYAKRNALDTMRVNLSDARVEKAIRQRGIFPKGSLPRVVVVSPRSPSKKSVVVMDEALSSQNLKRLVDSPVRHELARRLISGESAVWLLLESGDPKKDDALEQRMQTQLAKLTEEIKLPEMEPSDLRRINTAQDTLKIKFSILRFSRKNPDEQPLIQMLLSSDLELRPMPSEPIIFPIFGRGRILTSLVGEAITEQNIAEATHFITGSCSCELKASNPGMDLLIPIDWGRYINNLIGFDASAPVLTGYANFAPTPTNHLEEPQQSKTSEPKSNHLLRNLFVVGGVVGVIFGVMAGVVIIRNRQNWSS